ncbi:MAG: glycosyltransferase 87 family protein [Chloroflexota bacterium]|nr:glycosyltransferase 87 family protein [Chloroflexota bacterium]
MTVAGRRFSIPAVLVAIWLLLNLVALIYAGVTESVLSGVTIGSDFTDYIAGARALTDGGSVYELTLPIITTDVTYHPAFLLPIAALLPLPYPAQILIWLIVIILSYFVGAAIWFRVIDRLNFRYWHLLPLFVLITYDWIGNVSYGDATLLLVPLSGGLMWAVVTRRIAFVGVLAGVILLLKPQWCFPLLYALARRDDRTFVRCLLAALLGYLLYNAAFVLIVGVERGLSLLGEYWQYTFTLQGRYPWSGTESMFDSFQHSIYQTFARYGADTRLASIGTLVVQVAMGAAWLIALVRVRASGGDDRAATRIAFGGYILGMCLTPLFEEGLMLGFVAVVLWSVYTPSRLYLGYALMQFALIVGIVTGVQAFSIPRVIPTILIMMLILFVGVVRVSLAEPTRTVAPE